MPNAPDDFEAGVIEYRKLRRICNLMMVLLVCFVVAAVTLLSIGVPKAAKAKCPNDKNDGVVLVALGSICAALGATMTMAETSARKVIKHAGDSGMYQ